MIFVAAFHNSQPQESKVESFPAIAVVDGTGNDRLIVSANSSSSAGVIGLRSFKISEIFLAKSVKVSESLEMAQCRIQGTDGAQSERVPHSRLS